MREHPGAGLVMLSRLQGKRKWELWGSRINPSIGIRVTKGIEAKLN